ncbi:MAG: alpha/beta fold hydrolase [Proteobacteria bacterium]|nr:alpha/beta fold hydrolase [Pseudomonadota bacterium]
MKQRDVTIAATDGFELAALHLEPETDLRGVIQFHSGTGVKKEFYLKFAKYMAERGFAVILFDYRGIGGSRPKSLRGFEAQLRHWGERDMVGVLEWIKTSYPQLPKFIVAHSMGGQLIGLMKNHDVLRGVVTIAASTGYWRTFPRPYRYLPAFIWYVYIPIVSRIFGFVPAKRLQLGEDLPTGVAREWADWCTNRNYLRSFFGVTIEEQFFADIRAPVKAFYAEDDTIATERTVPEILEYFENAQVSSEKIRLSDVSAKAIGHFGFFSRKFGRQLWPKPIDWIETQLAE